MMKCLVCETPVPDDCWQCPVCGERLAQWLELDRGADEFYRDALHCLMDNQPLAAAIRLVKATVLQPDRPEVLKTLGLLLAGQGCTRDATFYLRRYTKLCREQGLEEDAQVTRALRLVGTSRP